MLCSRAVLRPILLPAEETMSRLERVLADSPAELTEISWIELRHGREGSGRRRNPADTASSADPAGPARTARTVVVSVWERGRAGSHRTGVGTVSELSAAVREALGQARLAPPAVQKPAPFPHEPPAVVPQQKLFDPEIAELEAAAARELLLRWTERGETARLGWVDGQLILAASDGRRRTVRSTAVALEVGRGPGRGGAAGAARSLAALDAPEIAARAGRRRPPTAPAPNVPASLEPPSEPVPLLLAPEAAAVLVDLLNRALFSSTAFRDPASPLRGRLGSALFDRAITLVDDGTDGSGLPFPCDLTGARKRPVELIREGVFLTPAVDGPLAAELGRPPTPHCLSTDESLAANLFLRPGGRSDEDLLREVGEAGGLWVGSLGGIEMHPGGPRFRARASGVRRIAGGELGEALPDLSWEDRLPDALSRVIGVGDRPLVVGAADPLRLFLGGTSAPALALDLRGRAAALYPARA